MKITGIPDFLAVLRKGDGGRGAHWGGEGDSKRFTVFTEPLMGLCAGKGGGSIIYSNCAKMNTTHGMYIMAVCGAVPYAERRTSARHKSKCIPFSCYIYLNENMELTSLMSALVFVYRARLKRIDKHDRFANHSHVEMKERYIQVEKMVLTVPPFASLRVCETPLAPKSESWRAI